MLGGIGLGLGYISPVSTLIKWFPDKPGMATGLAIMGFGGGAMIAAPLSVKLMEIFHRMHHGLGVTGTFVTLGLIYFTYMMFGVFTVRVPAPGWLPAGFVPTAHQSKLVSSYNVSVDNAWKTPQFWLLWIMLLVNVTAGIGVLSQASPMSPGPLSRARDRDDRRWLRGTAQHREHGGALRLVVALRRDRAQSDLSHLLHPWRRSSTSRYPRAGARTAWRSSSCAAS